MFDIYSIKQNYAILGAIFIVIALGIMLILNYVRPTTSFYDNIPWALLAGLLIVLGLYFIPVKPRLLTEPYETKIAGESKNVVVSKE